jgi:hypothetical protein
MYFKSIPVYFSCIHTLHFNFFKGIAAGLTLCKSIYVEMFRCYPTLYANCSMRVVDMGQL